MDDPNIQEYQNIRQLQQRRKRVLYFIMFGCLIFVRSFSRYEVAGKHSPRSNSTQLRGNQSLQEDNQLHQSSDPQERDSSYDDTFKNFYEWENSVLSGTWRNFDNQLSGKVQVKFMRQRFNHSRVRLFVQLIQGFYYEDPRTNLLYELSLKAFQQDNKTTEVSFSNLNVSIQQGDVYQEGKIFVCRMDLKIKEIKEVNSTKNLNLILQSHNTTECQVQLEFLAKLNSNMNEYMEKAIYYSIFVSLLSILQVGGSLQILRNIIIDENQAAQYSVVTLILISAQDGFACVLHFFFSLRDDTLFGYYITPSFMYFIIFSVLEIRIIILVWKHRIQNVQDGNLRREIIKFYLKFYLSILIMVIVTYNWIYSSWFNVLMNLFLLPQIIHTAQRGQPTKFDKPYIFLLLCPRTLIIFYFRGCPKNFISLEANYSLCMIVLLVVSGQIMIVYFQTILGPRFFIPKRFLPKSHQYFHDIELSSSEVEDCAICIQSLNQPPSTTLTEEERNNPQISQVVLRHNPNTMMKTPCDHKFHLICLVKWMSIRMNCPSCRKNLPMPNM